LENSYGEMTLCKHEWKWLIGLLPKESIPLKPIEELDKAITDFSTKLSSYNPEALLEMKKKVLWEGTQHWDTFCYNVWLWEVVHLILQKCLG
jgi:methylglutaconyl-CoA hydratase